MKNKDRLNFKKKIETFFLILITTLMGGCNTTENTAVKIIDLKCEYRSDPLGIDNIHPRLSWRLVEQKSTRGQKQTAYQILVASSLKNLNANIGDLWDSGKIMSDKSVNNTYQGKALESAKQYFWKVKVWDSLERSTDWSANGRFSMGLLEPNDWKGEWIYKGNQKKTEHNWYRKNFILSQKATTAFVHVGSFGYHELYVNGKKITENVMNPVSSYMKKRIPYLTYDITEELQKGDNVIAVWHAAGWARWRRISAYRNIPFVFKAQAEIMTEQEEIVVSTDKSWKCKKSHSAYYGDWDILRFGGEIIDDRKKEDNWNTAAYDDSDWDNVRVYDHNLLNTKIVEGDNMRFALGGGKNKKVRALHKPITAKLSAQLVEPQVKFKKITPIAIKDNDDGTYRIDMGENYTGFFEMNLYDGKAGDSVVFEISDQTELVMNWKQKSKYIFGASGKGTFTNRFNVAGGRWFTVYGLQYKPKLSDIKGYVVTSDRKQISAFESSDSQLNKIYNVNLNTYLANTMDGILVDCPHRERRGWGEVTVAAMYGDALPNFESGAYMDQYLQYTRDAQLSDGRTRAVINEQDRPFLMWKANNPLTIWETYRMLGDKKVLEDNYTSMQKWMTWLYQNSNYDTGGALKSGKRGAREFPGLGDWCTPRGNFWSSSNSPEAIHFNNCVYAFMLDNAVKIATVLDRTADAKILADRLRVQQKATHKLLYDPETGKYGNGQQVNQLFALLAGVTPNGEKKKVYDNLVDNVLYKFPYYDTGSSGQALYTRYFLEFGERMDLIYELLKDKHHPSYGYFLEQGKTVWPERWSAIGNSQIHTCYTGIGGYFVKGFGGIRVDPQSLGMQNMIIKPAVVGDLAYANTSYKSMYGNVVVNWKKQQEGAIFHIEIPINTTAKIYLPALTKNDVKEGGVLAETSQYISYVGKEKSDAVGSYLIFSVASGVYNFRVDKLPKTKFPEPLEKTKNLATLGRMNASSMVIKTEKLPVFEAFRANDEDSATKWQADKTQNQYLEIEWVKSKTFNTIVIDEDGDAISNYKIQYMADSGWKDVFEGSTCGSKKEHRFDRITTSKCRVLIIDAVKKPLITELEIYDSEE